MRTLLHVIHPRRAGGHAVINWLQENVNPGGETFFKNDIYTPHATIPGERILPRRRLKLQPTTQDTLGIISYEDPYLNDIPHLYPVRQGKEILPDSEQKFVLILRDPYNLFATRLKKMDNMHNPITDYREIDAWPETHDTQLGKELWKEYAKEFLGETNILGDNIIPINYNLWCSDKAYRDSLLKTHFNQEINKDIGFNHVPDNGGGSSYNFKDYDGKATEMQTDTRWRSFINDPEYRALVSDPEIRRLSEKIFGHIPGTEILYPSALEGYRRMRER